MSTVDQLLQDFYLLSGMRVVLYDRQRRCVAWAGPTAYSYCNAVHATQKGFNRCFASDEAAFEAVTKTRKTHTFTCPFGLFEAVVPVICQGSLRGYLFIGESVTDTDAQRKRALTEGLSYAGGGISPARLQTLIDSLATHSVGTQQALTRTLALFADALADANALDSNGEDVAYLLRDYLERNYQKRITLQDLALHFHYSTVTLTEHFKRTFGTTVLTYLTDKRIAAAKTLLREGTLPIGAVGAACGFENPEHFSKVFKKRTGLSPARFRAERE